MSGAFRLRLGDLTHDEWRPIARIYGKPPRQPLIDWAIYPTDFCTARERGWLNTQIVPIRSGVHELQGKFTDAVERAAA